ncbi:hypothetical protein [Sphingomonas sp. VNH70]|uniref:hypothetical protein n=1 Tax=Sphingomonas silueang TaxID=3156617 RepID=UPI0032B3162A
MGAGVDPALRDAIAAARERSLARARDAARADPLAPVAERLAAAVTLADAEAAARAVLGDIGWLYAVLGEGVRALGDDPLSEPAFTARRDTLRSGLVLLDTAAASVTLAAIDPRASAAHRLPDRLVVGGRVAWTRYLRGGGAQLWRWRADSVDAAWHAGVAATARPLSVLPLADDMVVRIDGRCDAMLLTGPSAPIVSLSVTLHRDAAPFMREYDRASGRLLRVATLDEDAARAQMLLTLVRELGQGTPDMFAAATRDPAFFLRWDAMREWLASDAAAALPALRAMTLDPHPEVARAATAMLPLVEARFGGGACRG